LTHERGVAAAGKKQDTDNPLHPQSDGMVERKMKTAEEHLRKSYSVHQKDWEKRLLITPC
jgi:hypothetical protein